MEGPCRNQVKDAGTSLFGGVATQREKWPVSAFRWSSPKDVYALMCVHRREWVWAATLGQTCGGQRRMPDIFLYCY